MKYELVFDVAEAGYRQWWVPATMLFLLVVWLGVAVFRHIANSPQPLGWRGWLYYLSSGFFVFLFVVSFAVTFSDYWHLREALRTGNYEVVEGKVTKFVPEPAEGHAVMEKFVVNGHRYEYSYWVVTAGFNNTQSHGGPMCEGLLVRIADVGGEIARLEIAR
jgi:hypothetical protein